MNLTTQSRISQGDLISLPARDLKWLAGHWCQHRKPLIIHPACYRGDEKDPKILLYDLETTANEGYYWGQNWQTNIIENINYGQILSFAAKWIGGKMMVRGQIDFKRNKEESLVKELWELFNQADYIVAHNGKKFDIRWCLTKFTQYNLPIPGPYKVVDTKTEAKKYLYLPSYSLNNIADYFGFGHKLEHEGFSLWKKCLKGDKKAWAKMKRYNAQDVVLLEKVYLKLKPFQK